MTLWTPPTLTGLTPGPVTLTRRRAEVLDRVCLGWVSAGIGRELFLSEQTVKTHLGRMLAQFGARNRAQLAALACSGQVAVGIDGKP